MIKILLAAAIALIASTAVAQTHVDGYFRKDGTYVPPHFRSTPDGSRGNNWSSQGNTNPYTGERGYRDPYAPKPPSYPYDGTQQRRKW